MLRLRLRQGANPQRTRRPTAGRCPTARRTTGARWSRPSKTTSAGSRPSLQHAPSRRRARGERVADRARTFWQPELGLQGAAARQERDVQAGVRGVPRPAHRPRPPGAAKRPSHFPLRICFAWRSCIGAQGAQQPKPAVSGAGRSKARTRRAARSSTPRGASWSRAAAGHRRCSGVEYVTPQTIVPTA